MSNVPSIPSIPGNIDPQLYQVLTAVKQVLDSSQGNALVTQNEMSGAISSAIDGVSGQAGIPGQTGANGETGSVGPTGDAYVLDITGGRTTISYDTNGASPLPPLEGHPFGYLLYKNGVAITDTLTYSWYIRDPGTSLLSGTGNISTFIPTLAATFDAAKADNVVMLTVNYGGLSFTTSEPVVITKMGAKGDDTVVSDLSNSNHTVPTLFDGSGGVFTGCATTMSVYIGNVDDSTNWTYAVTKSTGVTLYGGAGAITSRTQTVTAMTTDSGTVTLVASKAGYANLTQVFSLSKAKGGVSYRLLTSNNAISKTAAGALSPGSITFTAKQISTSSATAYSGVFKIYINGSGTATYVSANTGEASTPYTIEATDETIQCELWTIGASGVLVDSETIPVVVDGGGAAFFNITNSAATFLKGIDNVITPASLTLSTAYSNITPTAYLWSKSVNGGAYGNITGATSATYTITASTAYASATSISYKCTLTGTVNGSTGQVFSDVVTLPLLTDSKSVSTVVLSNENTTFPALVAGYSSITFTGGNCDVTAYIGSTKLTPTSIAALTATAYISALNMELTAGNQEATYAVATATLTCTKPIRSITAVALTTDIITSTGHGYALFDPVRYYYTGTALTGLTQNLGYYVVPIDVNTFYLATRTAVAAGAFVVGSKYVIAAIGTTTPTTQAQWNTIAGPRVSTYAVGSVFTCANIGTAMGDGTAFPIPDITSAVVAGFTYNVTGNGWDSGGYSNTSFTGGAKLTFKVVGGNGAMIGLNTDPSFNNSYSSIDYCFYFTGGIVRIYESNTNPYTGGAWLPTDVFTILYNNDTVSYYQNNTCLRTVEVASGLTFYFDSSFSYSNTLSPNQITNLGFSAYVAVGANTFTYDTVSVGATVADGVINSVSELVSIAAPTEMTTDTAYTDVIISPRDAADNALASITKRITYSLGRRGSNYVLFITGGITNTVYDTDGIHPLPAQTAFSCELYENGDLVTPATYAWSVPSTNTLLTGSSSTATFTPTLASTFDRTKSNNRVLLTVTYAGITVKAVQPIVMTQLVIATDDMTAPVAITGLTVVGGVLYNHMRWGTLPGNFDHVEIWRSATNNRGIDVGGVPSVAVLIGTSVFTVYVDYLPAGVGTLYYYWIRAISKAGVAGDWNALADEGTSAKPLGIGDQQVGILTAVSIDTATLGALSADLGGVTAGVIASPTGQMLIDLTSPQKIVMASASAAGGSWNAAKTLFTPGTYAGGDYIKMDKGQVTTYRWNGTAHESSQSLNTLEAGTCVSGTTVTLGKYYISAPKIMVSPYNLQVYNKTYSGQNQTLTLSSVITAGAVKGHYTFLAKATLNMAADISTTQEVNNTVNNTTNQPITSAERTTAAFSTALHVVATINSQRGDGLTSYYERQVLVRVKYGTVTGVYPNATPLQVIDLGPDITPNTVNLTFALGAAGTYKFVVEYTSRDDPNLLKFASGTEQYLYLQGSATLTANSALVDTGYVTSDTTTSLPVATTMTSFTPTAGYAVYSVDYTVKYGYYLEAANIASLAKVLNNAGTILQQLTYPYAGAGSTSSGVIGAPTATSTTTFSTTSYSPTTTLLTAQAAGHVFSDAYAKTQVKIFAAGTTATIYTRKANTNAAVAIANSFTLNSFYTDLSAGATAVPGYLNWIAIG